MTDDSRWKLPVGLALAVVTLLVYFPSFSHDFVYYDDPVYVFQNVHVQAGLTADSARWAFQNFESGHWHPLTWLSLELVCTLYGGLNAAGYHLTNVLLHSANTVLLFLILSWLTGHRSGGIPMPHAPVPKSWDGHRKWPGTGGAVEVVLRPATGSSSQGPAA